MSYTPIDFTACADPASASKAIGAFLSANASSVPARNLEVLNDYYPSWVNRLIATAEALYASLGEMSGAPLAAAQTLVAQIAFVCHDNAFDILGQTDRSLTMIKAMRRDLGDTTVTQTADQDPVPLTQYAPPPAAPAPGGAA